MTPLYLHAGKRLGTSYELEMLVGTGQFGQVWRAKKITPPTDQPVALKIPIDHSRGEEVLMADGRYMLNLPAHPGVVRVHWQGRVGSVWVIEMEFVNGVTLARLMEDAPRWAKITFEDIVGWFIGVAEALAFLHGNNVAHGDLKPDNLLVDETSNRLKITDFGTSRRLTDNLIRTPRHAGAWAYQAPEIQTANQRGAISDLFSLGAVLYHSITGRLPRANIHDLLTMAPIPRPRQFNPAIPAELDRIVMELLEDDPSKRVPSGSELVKRLERVVGRGTSQSVPPMVVAAPGTGYLDCAVALLKDGKKEEARAAAAQAALHSTGLVPALELYARLSEELGYLDDAVQALRRLLCFQITAGETRRSAETQLAGLYLRLHQYEDAEHLVEATICTPAANRSTLFTAAVALGACTRLERSLELLDRIATNDPHDAAALEKKAWVLWLLHRYDEAAAIARDALEIMPDNELCLRRLVEYETLGGNPRRAEFYRRRLEAVGL